MQTTSSKTQKRIRKVKGFLNQAYSVVSLKYTPFNYRNLVARVSKASISRLHVGCGLTVLDGWCNILYEPGQEYGVLKQLKEKTFYLNYNLLKPWPFAEGSIQHIAGAHFIEHLDLNDCLKFLHQAYQVLKSGGSIRLSCPDLEIYARNYLNNNAFFFANEEIKKACTFQNARTPSQIFIAKAYDSGGAHKWFHDFSSLKDALERTGFTDVRKLTRLTGRTPDLDKLELPQRESESLYVEAVKP